jgi:hypothetical protein
MHAVSDSSYSSSPLRNPAVVGTGPLVMLTEAVAPVAALRRGTGWGHRFLDRRMDAIPGAIRVVPIVTERLFVVLDWFGMNRRTLRHCCCGLSRLSRNPQQPRDRETSC